MSGHNNYSTQALLRANAPLQTVLDSFINDVTNKDDPSEITMGIKSQEQFVSLIISIKCQHQNSGATTDIKGGKEGGTMIDWSRINFLPSRRYIQKLVQRYTSQLETNNIILEDDNLASLVCYFSTTLCGGGSALPDPTNCSLVTFCIPPSTNKERAKDNDGDILQIRTYPYHNDVGIAKVWEAGACLAEYIISYPQCIQGKNVLELGAGVGLTGLIASAEAKSVHMTDYTEACLDNLAYNVCENSKWLKGRGVDPDTVTVVSMKG